MAKPYIYRNFQNNLLLTSKNKLAKKAFTKKNSTFIYIATVFHIFIFVLVQIFTLVLPSIYININFQKTTKLDLELFVKDQK